MLPIPPELAYLGGFLTTLIGALMFALAVMDRREKSSERRFDELQDLHGIAMAGERHARERLAQVRLERDEWKAKYERGEITIATLREKLEMCDAKQRVYRRVLMRHGITNLDVDDESTTA